VRQSTLVEDNFLVDQPNVSGMVRTVALWSARRKSVDAVREKIGLMNKSSKTISLVLIGSALTLSGCSSALESEDGFFDEETQANQANSHHAGSHLGAGAGVYAATRLLGRGAGGGGTVGVGASARGGFGSPGGFSAAT
jgi:hypothetical protein